MTEPDPPLRNFARVLMFDVTESLANTLFSWANVLLVIGAAAVLIGTIGVFSMGYAKEQFSNERIAASQAEAARANESAGRAYESAARANAEAAKSQLALAEFKEAVGPRRIRPNKLAVLIPALAAIRSKFTTAISVQYVGTDDEELFAHDIAAALRAAHVPFALNGSRSHWMGGYRDVLVVDTPDIALTKAFAAAGIKLIRATDAPPNTTPRILVYPRDTSGYQQ